MRLLNTETLAFEEFNVPPSYAILSHRWSEREVSFEGFSVARALDYQVSVSSGGIARDINPDLDSPGYRKIVDCCQVARSRKHRYVWIDTCCIDKRSSAELSEAINSMWEWYSNATECLAYLSDVPPLSAGRERVFSRMEVSTWYRRGWTLQELLAPRIVTLCTSAWEVIGQKSDVDLRSKISAITSIPESCLVNQYVLHTKCIAQRLSWASKRSTTRVEDQAYCLLGLVGVSMPLLYGEGSKAFLRLQQEIIRQTDDESIFAWRYISPPKGYMSGILASHVSLFATSGNVILRPNSHRAPYAVTNKGLELQSTSAYIPSLGVYIIPLSCVVPLELDPGSGGDSTQRCEIVIQEDNGAYYRVAVSRLGGHLKAMYADMESTRTPRRTFYIKLSRWEHRYQPAVAALTKLIVRWKQGRQKEAMRNFSKLEQT